ncbi:MAG: hypothetical protein HYZ34_01325 [Ignavibacteriae bacterium]|nr:hypothetical protein [Ignavibacteriota bacterium]
MKKHYLIFTLLFLSITFTSTLSLANPKGDKVLIHVVTNIKIDDGPPCVAFDIAYANLAMGNSVEMFFDSEAAWNLKRTSADGKNDFDRYEVPADLKKLVVSQFNDKDITGVKDFGEFLELLSKKGAVISVNGTWNVLTSVEKDLKGKTVMPSFVNPLTLKEMVEHLNSAQKYYRY